MARAPIIPNARERLFGAHGVDAALTLDENGHHIGVADGGLLERLNVVQWYADETFHQWAEALLNLLVAGGTQGGDVAAKEGLLVDHDCGLVMP